MTPAEKAGHANILCSPMMTPEDRMLTQLEIAHELFLQLRAGHQISDDVLDARIQAIKRVIDKQHDLEWARQMRR